MPNDNVHDNRTNTYNLGDISQLLHHLRYVSNIQTFLTTVYQNKGNTSVNLITTHF
jgi:hypothetical protein